MVKSKDLSITANHVLQGFQNAFRGADGICACDVKLVPFVL